MNDDIDVEREDQRAREDELIRQHQLAQAIEWAEYEHKYGWMRQPVKARRPGAEN